MLSCIGLNHKAAPVEVRERLAVAENLLGETATAVAQLEGVEECVVLATCNRVELYAAGPAPQTALTAHLQQTAEAPDLPLYELDGDEATRHLYRVVSGMDSMVLGETEIFGQVKRAYSAAHAAGATRKLLNKLFQQAFSVGKFLRSNTKIQHGSTSVGSAAVDLAEKIFGSLNDSKVLLLGAGEQSRVTAQSLASRGAPGIFVSNRSFDKAEALAGEIGGSAIRFDDWEPHLAEADIVISSTSAPHHLVTRENLSPALRSRRGRPLFVIDLAVPRDVEPEVHQLDGVYLYDIDHLSAIAAKGREERLRHLEICEGIISEQLEKFPTPAVSTPRPSASDTQESPPGNSSPNLNPRTES